MFTLQKQDHVWTVMSYLSWSREKHQTSIKKVLHVQMSQLLQLIERKKVYIKSNNATVFLQSFQVRLNINTNYKSVKTLLQNNTMGNIYIKSNNNSTILYILIFGMMELLQFYLIDYYNLFNIYAKMNIMIIVKLKRTKASKT